MEDVPIGRGLQVGSIGHGSAQLLDLVKVPALEAGELVPGVLKSAVQAIVVVDGGAAQEEPDKLQAAELEFQVAPSRLQRRGMLSGPVDGRQQVVPVSELVQDQVHLSKLPLQRLGTERADVQGRLGAAVRIGRPRRRHGPGWIRGRLGQKGRGHGELAFAEQVHGDRTVDQGGVGRDGIVARGRQRHGLEVLHAA